MRFTEFAIVIDQLKKRSRIIVLMVTVLLFFSLASIFSSNSGTAELNTDLQAIEFLPQLEGPYEEIQPVVSIPVLLPIQIPGIDDFWVTPTSSEDGDSYLFTIDIDRECQGAGACSRGSFGGELVTETTETLEERYEHLETGSYRGRSSESVGSVSLSSGIEGMFYPWVATAQCTEARVYWLEEDEVRYHVGIECGKQADLVEFANSVIDNTDRGN